MALKNPMPAPASWMDLSPAYDNEKDNKDRSDGDDYSFINYVGDKRHGITSMSSTINFLSAVCSTTNIDLVKSLGADQVAGPNQGSTCICGKVP
jgi:hypothetical protein